MDDALRALDDEIDNEDSGRGAQRRDRGLARHAGLPSAAPPADRDRSGALRAVGTSDPGRCRGRRPGGESKATSPPSIGSWIDSDTLSAAPTPPRSTPPRRAAERGRRGGSRRGERRRPATSRQARHRRASELILLRGSNRRRKGGTIMTKLTRIIAAAGLAFSGLAILGSQSEALDPAKDFCGLSADQAARSCQVGARSDQWLALGKCLNLSERGGAKGLSPASLGRPQGRPRRMRRPGRSDATRSATGWARRRTIR